MSHRRSCASIAAVVLACTTVLAAQPAVAISGLTATTLSIGPSTHIAYGGSTTLITHLKANGAYVPGRTIRLYQRTGTSGPFSFVASRTTSATGGATAAVSPRRNVYYRWSFAGDSGLASSYSVVELVSVAQGVSVHLSRNNIPPGTTVSLFGLVSPTVMSKYVYLQGHDATGWHTTTLKSAIASRRMPDGVTRTGYVITFAPRHKYYRVYSPASASNLAGYSSQVVIIFVSSGGGGVPPEPADRDCSDFATQAAAQSFFEYYYPYYGDFSRLDADNDFIACEALP